MKHSFATVGDIRLHYVEAGEGPLVVLLHGFPETWFSWRHQIPALAAAGFHVVAPDLRGYGESSKPEGIDHYRMQEIAKDVAGLIVQKGGRCMLVGHDWGGFATWFTAMLYPDLVQRVAVLNAPHPALITRELNRSLAQKLRLSYQLFLNLPKIPELLLPFLLNRLRHAGRFTQAEVEEYRDTSWSRPGTIESMLAYYRALRRSRKELRSLMRPINVPTLFIFGERDPVFTPKTADGYGDWVPDVRVERLPRAGHFVQTDEAERVTRLLIEFGEPLLRT